MDDLTAFEGKWYNSRRCSSSDVHCATRKARVPTEASAMGSNLRDKIEYVALCIDKFAAHHGIARSRACECLHSNDGLHFLDEFYTEESTQSDRIMIEDLDEVCRNYGGVPTW